MAITKVWIEEGCVASGLCSNLCPQVFVLKDFATVIEGISYSGYEAKYKGGCRKLPNGGD